MQEHTRDIHITRINAALHYIEEHLADDLSLEKVAAKVYYSPFHFHRLFKHITGEPLNTYISRKRVEKCAISLATKSSVPINEIGLQHGFTSNSSFTRAFKKYYGVSPSDFRNASAGMISKIRQIESKNGQNDLTFDQYLYRMNELLTWIDQNAKVAVKDLEENEIAYITQIGDQGLTDTINRLIKWAGPKGLMNEQALLGTCYHDSFKVTSPDKVRMSVFILIDDAVTTDGEVSKMKLSGGKHIVGRFEISLGEFEKAWTAMFQWMIDKGYAKADNPPFELYYNDYKTHPQNKCIIDLCIPVL
ncbi:MAG: GyrI-like domain-containing protein [Bacteroidota bacterium]